MPFTTPVIISPISEKGWRTKWKVWETITYHSPRFDRDYQIEKGFETDLASGFIAAASAPAILHDRLYNSYQVSGRREADDIFFEAMQDEGVPTWRCWSYYMAVRFFGWRYYKAYAASVMSDVSDAVTPTKEN